MSHHGAVQDNASSENKMSSDKELFRTLRANVLYQQIVWVVKDLAGSWDHIRSLIQTPAKQFDFLFLFSQCDDVDNLSPSCSPKWASWRANIQNLLAEGWALETNTYGKAKAVRTKPSSPPKNLSAQFHRKWFIFCCTIQPCKRRTFIYMFVVSARHV